MYRGSHLFGRAYAVRRANGGMRQIPGPVMNLCRGRQPRESDDKSLQVHLMRGPLVRGQTGDAVALASMLELAGRPQACDFKQSVRASQN